MGAAGNMLVVAKHPGKEGATAETQPAVIAVPASTLSSWVFIFASVRLLADRNTLEIIRGHALFNYIRSTKRFFEWNLLIKSHPD